MEKKKMKNSVVFLMILGLVLMGIMNSLLYKFELTDISIIVIDIVYAITLGASLRKLNS
jgi:hypothetical protein